MDICTAHSCSNNTIAYLATLIEEHHSQFIRLYDRSLIPKMHFMVHYPQQISQFGPLINAWCMRMESKLKLCKRVARYGDFKNICLSVANSHQRWMCMQLHLSMIERKLVAKPSCVNLLKRSPSCKRYFRGMVCSLVSLPCSIRHG